MKKRFAFFRSMRFGMLLMALLMLLSLAGSLIVQQQPTMTYVERFGSRGGALIVGLGLDDIFHTWYFYALLSLLCLNLLLCSVLRFPRALGAMERLRRAAAQAAPERPLPPEQRARAEAFLRQNRFRRRGDVWQKNAAGVFGSFLTHLAILLVIAFGALALLTPSVEDRTVMPGGTLTLADGVTVTCERFQITDGSGRLDYASLLTVTDGKTAKTQEIRVNQPLRFGPWKIYQQTYGTAGRVRITNDATGGEDTLFLTEPCMLAVDERNGVYYNALYPAFLRGEDGNYTLITSTDGSYPDPVYSVQSVRDGLAASVLAFPGEEIHMDGVTFTFLAPAEYPGLRLKRVSPALYAGLYAAFALMVAALYLCFFAAPVCARVGEDGLAWVSPKDTRELAARMEAALAETGGS